jgi:orotate phosphoribosyltransferase
VILEDMISTGGSSLKVAQALRDAEANVLGMTAIFTYEFPIAINRFKENRCKLYTISTFSTLVDVALEDGYISEEEVDKLSKWHQNPQAYSL